jgi:Protein of unknown function (DUF3341)
MPAERGVLGVFAEVGDAARAVRALRDAGHAEIRFAAPAPYPVLVEALGRPRSRLDSVTLSGAALGVIGGFALCIGTALAWPLMTGGKPIVSIPPFVIIAFELSVLVGAVVNLTALAFCAGRGRRRRAIPYDPRFSADRIGVFVVGGDLYDAERTLRTGGAEEVRHVA